MSLQSFYPKSQIITGLYTAGGQWQLADGTEYIGPYHQYISDRLTYTNAQYQKGVSKQLFPLQLNVDIIEYNKAAKTKSKIWATPRYYLPVVQAEHITQGWMPRYFVQVRNQPLHTIIEIDSDQFDNIGTTVTGIDSVRYKSLNIRWKITGTLNEIIDTNRFQLINKNIEFPGIVNYLSNLIEFSEFSPIRKKI